MAVDLSQTITLQQLYDMCHQYDVYHGEYPESSYEGKAVLDEILESLNIDVDYLFWDTYEKDLPGCKGT